MDVCPPWVADRREDIAANLDFELERFARAHRRQVRLNEEAREAFLKFARHPEALWSANFRDLNAAVTRMATLAPKGRLTEDVVRAEIARLREAWRPVEAAAGTAGPAEPRRSPLAPEQRAAIDPFDLAQLEYVIGVCGESVSLSDAGRRRFAVSRTKRTTPNDADRLKKYLARFGLKWDQLRAVPATESES